MKKKELRPETCGQKANFSTSMTKNSIYHSKPGKKGRDSFICQE